MHCIWQCGEPWSVTSHHTWDWSDVCSAPVVSVGFRQYHLYFEFLPNRIATSFFKMSQYYAGHSPENSVWSSWWTSFLILVKAALIWYRVNSASSWVNVLNKQYHNRRLPRRKENRANIRQWMEVTNPSHTSVIATFHSPVRHFWTRKWEQMSPYPGHWSYSIPFLFITLSVNRNFTIDVSSSLHKWYPRGRERKGEKGGVF